MIKTRPVTGGHVMPREDSQWKPGQSGNPKGRPPTPKDLKGAKELNKVELERILNKYIYMSRSEMNKAIKKKDTPAIELLVISLIQKGMQYGDPRRIEAILERLVGKVKKEVELQGNTIADLFREDD